MDWLVQTHYPEAPLIKLVQDDYDTHSYEAFHNICPLKGPGNCVINPNSTVRPSTAPGSG